MPDLFVASQSERVKESFDSAQGKQKSKSVEIPKTPTDEKGHNEHPPKHQNPLAAYIYKPRHIYFETKHSHEEVMLLLRRHPITNIPWILIVILMIAAPVLLSYFPILAFLPPQFGFITIISWYLVTTAYVLENFLIWFFNVSIVTSERVVDIDFVSLLHKEVTDTEIDKIQDATYKMTGAIRAFFNYGDVFIQTASEIPSIEFLAVPNPARVARVLQGLRAKV